MGSINIQKPASLGVNVTTASSIIVALKAGRHYLQLHNESDTDIYLGIGTAAVLHTGIRLVADGGTYEMSPEYGNLSDLPIYAIHEGSGNKVICGFEA